MTKTSIAPADYITQLNEVLRREEKFRPGMRFYLNPNYCAQDTSIDVAWFEPFVFLDLAASVQKKVDEEFQIVFFTKT